MADFVQHNIEKLNSDHQTDKFDCGKSLLNDYLLKHALKNEALGYGRTYVATRQGTSTIEGFFTISMSSVMFANLPDELIHQVPKYPMPVAHIGCLAVHVNHHGKGLGGFLLINAFQRILIAADLVAARAVDVRAIDDKAREWYLKRGFLPFKDHPNHLYLPLATIATVVAAAQ